MHIVDELGDRRKLRLQKFKALQEQAAKVGIEINVTKTKETRIQSLANIGNISWTGQVLERGTALT